MKHNSILIILVFVLMVSHASIIGAATEKPKVKMGNGGILINTTEHFAIGTLSLAPSDQVIYYNNKPVAEYILESSYYSPGWPELFSAESKKKIAPFIDKLVVLKGHHKLYPTNRLRKHNGDVVFKELSRAHMEVFEITDIIPATIKQDDEILSIKAPSEISDKKSEFSIKLRNPFPTQLENSILDIHIKGGLFPKNLAIEDWENSLFPYPQGKRTNVLLSPEEIKEIRVGIVKKEESTVLEKATSKSSLRINVAFIGYRQQTRRAEVITASLGIDYEEKYIGRFEYITNGKIYGAILHTSFGKVVIDKWHIKRYGDISSFNDKTVKISGNISQGPPIRITSIESIETIDKEMR